MRPEFALARRRDAGALVPVFAGVMRLGAVEPTQANAHRRRLLIEQSWRIVEATDPDLESKYAFARTVTALKTLLGAA